MRLNVKRGVTQVFKILNEAFTGDLNASFVQLITWNVADNDQQQHHLQFLKNMSIDFMRIVREKLLY